MYLKDPKYHKLKHAGARRRKCGLLTSVVFFGRHQRVRRVKEDWKAALSYHSQNATFSVFYRPNNSLSIGTPRRSLPWCPWIVKNVWNVHVREPDGPWGNSVKQFCLMRKHFIWMDMTACHLTGMMLGKQKWYFPVPRGVEDLWWIGGLFQNVGRLVDLSYRVYIILLSIMRCWGVTCYRWHNKCMKMGGCYSKTTHLFMPLF